MEISWSYSQNMEDEYQKFIRRMNPPRVVIDNESCKNATIIQELATAQSNDGEAFGERKKAENKSKKWEESWKW
ncbi:hypothetical protein L6452_43555 [Arctium lappa]|uniref:Uncharacterized protein n=1 Tax=Arctium lappa TaxID=4217 RepID=A0ACB8XCU5_ARCLA|nr:hypothetical protein L6452_43555 [Arctium lappa]